SQSCDGTPIARRDVARATVGRRTVTMPLQHRASVARANHLAEPLTPWDSSQQTAKLRDAGGPIRPAFGRKRGTSAIGLIALVAAAIVLLHILRDIDFDKVAAALYAQPARNILVAGGFVVACYITLIFYDWFALRTIGRHAVPFHVAAVAGFTSFT